MEIELALLIPATAGSVIVLNLVNRIVYDWLKNKKGNPNGNPNGFMRTSEHERLCNSRLGGLEEKITLIYNIVRVK